MKHLFLLFTCAVISLQSATERSASPSSSPCDRIHFPNYFKWVGHDEEALRLVNQSIGSVLKQLKISHFNGNVYTNRDFFEHINDVVQEKAPGAKVYISGGVVRSILGYIYKKMYNQAEREGHIEGSQVLVLDVFNRIIGAKSRKYDPTLADMPMYEGDRSKNEKDLIPLDALGIGSDYDILIEFPEGFAGNKQAVLNEVKDFINSADIQFNMQGDDSALKHMIVPYADVGEYQQQMGEAASEGGSLLDLLAYPVTGGEIREPENYAGKDQYPSIMQSFLRGQANYVTGTKQPHNPTKQTIRGLRPLLEIPFLKVDEASQRVMVEELQKITSLDHASQLQLDKMTRNARFQGAHNRFGIDCNQDGALSLAVKELAKRLGWDNLISEFADKRSITPTAQDQELEALLTPMDVFIAQCTAKDEEGNPTGILYHGTPKIDNLLSMLRSGLLISRPTEEGKQGQGTAALGRGVYTTPNLSIAEGYAKSDGIIIPLNVNTHKPFRILDVRQLHVQAWLQKHKLMPGIIPNTEKLYRNYGIDVVVVNYEQSAAPLIQNQEVVSIPKDITFLIQRMQNALLSKLKRKEPVPGDQFLKLFDPQKGYARLLKTLDPSIDTTEIANIAYQLALEIALDGVKSINETIHVSALVLFKALVEGGYEKAFNSALSEASNGMRSRSANVKYASFNIFKVLFEKGKGFKEAIEIEFELTSSNDFSYALQLFKELIEKGFYPAYQPAIAAASAGMKNDNNYVQNSALQLFKALFEKGQGYEEAIEGIKNNDFYSVFQLLEVLVKKGQGYREAIKAASEGLKRDSDIHSAYQLFEVLFENMNILIEQNQYEFPIILASEGMKIDDHNIKLFATELFKRLYKEKVALLNSNQHEHLIQLASTAINIKDREIQSASLDIFNSLLEVGRGI
jgi:hypothetical protein